MFRLMKNFVITLLALLVTFSCSEASIPSKIILSCSCIESESSNNKCLYRDINPEVEVNFDANIMTFGEKILLSFTKFIVPDRQKIYCFQMLFGEVTT